MELFLGPSTEVVIIICHIKSTLSGITTQLRNGSLLLHSIREDDYSNNFLICVQLMRHPLTELFHFSSLPQIPNDLRMVDTEFFGNLPSSCKRISFDDSLQLAFLTASHYAPHPRALSSFVRLLEPPLLCVFISSSWAKCIDTESCLPAL